jgi:hypothetical protein
MSDNNMDLKNFFKVSDEDDLKAKNRGTGAGGKNTNKNGLPYEYITELSTEYDIINKYPFYSLISFKTSEKLFKYTKQSNFKKCMRDKILSNIPAVHGTHSPDECYIDEEDKIVFIIEKKFQQCSGSVCEKIQTADCKRRNYQKRIPDYKIVYMYCLSDWFKDNCKAELEYLQDINIPVFWGSDKNYKNSIIKSIIDYNLDSI